jgi:hypothetical protein
VGEDVELEVLVALGQLVDARQSRLERLRRVQPVHDERRDGAKRHRVHDTQCAQAHAGGSKRVAIGARGRLDDAPIIQYQLDGLDLGRDVAEPGTRAMGRGRDRPGERLLVDVAQVLHREPQVPERRAQLAQRDPGLDPHQARLGIRVEHPVERLDPDHRAVGERCIGEGMTGAGRVDPQPVLRRLPHGVSQPLEGPRPIDRRRRAPLIPCPVSPLVRHRAQA